MQWHDSAFNLALHILVIKLDRLLIAATIESSRNFIFFSFAATEEQSPSDPEKDAINYNRMSQFSEIILVCC